MKDKHACNYNTFGSFICIAYVRAEFIVLIKLWFTKYAIS